MEFVDSRSPHEVFEDLANTSPSTSLTSTTSPSDDMITLSFDEAAGEEIQAKAFFEDCMQPNLNRTQPMMQYLDPLIAFKHLLDAGFDMKKLLVDGMDFIQDSMQPKLIQSPFMMNHIDPVVDMRNSMEGWVEETMQDIGISGDCMQSNESGVQPMVSQNGMEPRKDMNIILDYSENRSDDETNLDTNFFADRMQLQLGQDPSIFHQMNTPMVFGNGLDEKPNAATKKQRRWTREEDQLLKTLVKKHGSKWVDIATEINGRDKKQCKDRWLNFLRPDIKRDPWSEEEDMILIKAQADLGNKWSKMMKSLPGRPENTIKNRWYKTLHSQKWRRAKCATTNTLLKSYIESLHEMNSLLEGAAANTGSVPTKDDERLALKDINDERNLINECDLSKLDLNNLPNIEEICNNMEQGIPNIVDGSTNE